MQEKNIGMIEGMQYSEEFLSNLLDGIYSGEITQYNIPLSLYEQISSYLKKGLYKGFGGTIADFVGSKHELLYDLRENVYMFSAAKSYQQVKELQSLMFDENGKIVSQKVFNQLGAKTFEIWNEHWGRSEYGTAQHQALMANQWSYIQETKDLLPYLRYSTIGKACEICSPLDGLTAPVDDKIWRKITPVNHFNCYCLLEQHEPDVKATPEDRKEELYDSTLEKMDEVFKMNAGIDKYVFSPEHPYFVVPKADKEYAKRNFDLPVPKKD